MKNRSLIFILIISIAFYAALSPCVEAGVFSNDPRGIPPGTTRADGSAHQNNDTLLWSDAYVRWIAAAGGGGGTWGSITGTATNQTEFSGLTSTGMVKNTGTTGALSIAAAGTDYSAPITAAPADSSYSGAAITCKNGEAGSMALGDVVFIANGATATVPTVNFAKADTTTSDKMPAMGMVMATITAGATGPVLLSGFVQNTGWSALTVGGMATGQLWVSITGTTGNTWTQTKPATIGNVQQYLGCAINDAYSAAHTGQSKTIYFNPSPVWNVVP